MMTPGRFSAQAALAFQGMALHDGRDATFSRTSMTGETPVTAGIRLSAWRNGVPRQTERCLAEETPIAITYNELPYAVMMASPLDLDDFALGFTLTEGFVTHPGEIISCKTVPHELGVELRMVLARPALERVLTRRRRVAGYTGCGVCGLESLEQAMRPLPKVAGGIIIQAEALRAAFAGLAAQQPLNQATRSVHAAAFWSPELGLGPVREDVGRHNALDKLAGAMAQAGIAPAQGAVLLTSRISIELVQKAAVTGIPLLAAISAPTALAVRAAEQAGITLAAIVREDGFELFTHGWRIDMD
jgi:FdhD protein